MDGRDLTGFARLAKGASLDFQGEDEMKKVIDDMTSHQGAGPRKLPQKLTLRRETLRVLSSGELREALGGTEIPPTGTVTQQTECTTVSILC